MMMPPASQSMSARSMICGRLSMGSNRMMVPGSAPSSIGQLTTNTVLKKTPKKKRGRVKRSLKEFERGKGGDHGPSPKFPRVGKRQRKWNVEPHYTLVRHPVSR